MAENPAIKPPSKEEILAELQKELRSLLAVQLVHGRNNEAKHDSLSPAERNQIKSATDQNVGLESFRPIRGPAGMGRDIPELPIKRKKKGRGR